MTLTVEDLNCFQHQHPDHRLELVDGAIIVMSPSGFESDEIAAEIVTQLQKWVRPHKLGLVTASSAGFKLPNADGDVRAPDASKSGSSSLWVPSLAHGSIAVLTRLKCTAAKLNP